MTITNGISEGVSDGLTYWIIYRMSDDISISEKYDQAEREVVGTYNNVVVERIQISE